MTPKPNLYILIGTVFILLTWLFVGLFRDDEFNEPTLFTKYRPTFKVNFYSPIGMQDLELKELSPDKQKEEIAFREFVIGQNQQNNSHPRLWFIPPILFQLIITFLTLAILKMRRKLVYKNWQPAVHFTICIILTTITFGFILSFDNLISTLILGLLILTINYWALTLLTRQKAE